VTAPAVQQPAAQDAPHRLTLRPILRLAWRTLPYLKEARRDIVWLAVLTALLVAAALKLAPLLYNLGYDSLLLGKPTSMSGARLLRLPIEDFVQVDALDVAARQLLRGRLMVLVLGSALLLTPFVLALINFWVRLQQHINQGLRVEMMEHVQAMSLRFHTGSQVGDAIYRAYQDSAMVTTLMSMLVRPLVPLFFMFVGLVIVFAYDRKTALALVVMYLLGFALSFYYGRRLRVSFRVARESNSALTSQVQETMAAIKVVKAFGTESLERQRFERRSDAAFEAAYRARMQLATLGIASFALAALPAMAAAAYIAVWAAGSRPISAALPFVVSVVWTLGAYKWVTFVTRAMGASATHSLLKQWGELQNAAVGMDRAFAHVDLDPEVKDTAGAGVLERIEREIVFRGVSFAYEPDRPVLHAVDLRACAGKITALCGPTGSGKSTLVSLLLRLFDPDQGRIEIDGVDIRSFTLQSLRDGVAIALQENLLFGTTIAENIRYARPSASDAEVREAARIACALEFIEALPLGFDTPLGERGSKLSTGQRQRLSIARAIIKDAPVLILDEPTASLDAETELRVLENLAAWAKGRAVLLITHRLSTIRRADEIVYLRDGAVVESGTPAELMLKPGGAYRRFVEIEREAGSLQRPEQRV
jgi:ATP-binding cassette, subfamily B, bacterial